MEQKHKNSILIIISKKGFNLQKLKIWLLQKLLTILVYTL